MADAGTQKPMQTAMGELDRIELALATKRLDPALFERCVTDILADQYPGLSPVPEGTDHGRDADLYVPGETVPTRIMITTACTPKGVQANMVKSLKSMTEHSVAYDRIILANRATLNERQRASLRIKAQDFNATITAFYDHGFFASRLRRDGAWRAALLGIPGNPISLTRIPADLAERPWTQLSSIGREAELQVLNSLTCDVVVAGPPGVGKTRLVAELEDVVFVDPDFAETGSLADDLRWIQPRTVVVDDAGQHLALLRTLVKLRRHENELLSYRIIAIGWPDETTELCHLLAKAQPVEVGLLDRASMDRIIVEMGVRNRLARSEILDQAEGRPGWAVALASMLTQTNRWDSLFSGTVLIAEAQRYLQRSSIAAETQDVIATIAALGGIRHDQMNMLASILALSPTAVRRSIEIAAHSGLIDVESVWAEGDVRQRCYTVRPPMLADALVAQQAFRTPVPSLDLLDLADRWTGPVTYIALAAINSALLGADEAKPVASHFIHRFRANSLNERPLKALAARYACIDRHTGAEMLSWARQEADSAFSASATSGLAGVVEIATIVAGRYLNRDAVKLLLDAAYIDSRTPHQHSDHPLRKLEDLIGHEHPDIIKSVNPRNVIADTAGVWIAQRIGDNTAWAVYGATIRYVLSLHVSSRYLDHVHRRQLHMVETVLTPDEARVVYIDTWPQIKERLAAAPSNVVKNVVDVALDWLRIGHGYDRPFNAEHPHDSITAARELGEALLRDLTSFVNGRPGLTIYVNNAAARLGIEITLAPLTGHVEFFVGLDRDDDVISRLSVAQAGVARAVQPWVGEEPWVVIARLRELKTELHDAGMDWPNRIEWACRTIAAEVDNPTLWTAVALDMQLFPEAEPFVNAMVSRSLDIEAAANQIARCLDMPTARWAVINAVLSDPGSEHLMLVLATLRPSDYRTLEAMAFRRQLTSECLHLLLTATPDAARGMATFAMARPVHEDDDNWPPPEIEEHWLEAIRHFDPGTVPEAASHDLDRLARFLGQRFPDTLYSYVIDCLDAAASRDEWWSPNELLTNGIRHLTRAHKTRVWQTYRPTNQGWFLARSIAGNDVTWLGEMLDAGLMTTADALKARDGLIGPEPTLTEMAQLLIPRGVEPIEIAVLAELGVSWGEDSERAARLVDEFTKYAGSDDPSTAAVGTAGVTYYQEKRDIALSREAKARIRGQM
ncbi:hypothetical protein Cs7R123_10240 [Catellatospora sp. TT07R-123]|uniref:ATP-binding protein n=1 Tax=Catellatospora sp. TT07R-123 TaxID=2733863 RepID=UPI001B09BBAA|nr:ATP-binding protein [Catellatospora sp. TT07R-123]GHJ43682.1 hypothetical protein Cs7R123_10240 [Catellatospora sp. TT07R-123]